MAIQIIRKLLFCFVVTGAFWFLCSFLLKKNIKNNSITTTYLQNTTSVKSTTKAKPKTTNRTMAARHLLHDRTQKIASPRIEIESLARSPLDQLELQDEDLKQTILIEEITAEINSTRSSWWSLREQIYDEMQINEQVQYNLLQAREDNYKVLEEIANNLQIASEEEKSNLVNAYKQNRESFNLYVQQTIGPMRFNYLKKAQAKLNEALKAQNLHGTQVSEDW